VSRFLIAGTEIERPFDDEEEEEEDGCHVQQRASSHVLIIGFIIASLAWMWRPRRSRARRS
jgi:hypothetical protein